MLMFTTHNVHENTILSAKEQLIFFAIVNDFTQGNKAWYV